MTNEPITPVIFRVWQEKYVPGQLPGHRDKEVFALFPTLPADCNGYYCTTYVHLGQHSSANYHRCIDHSCPAKPEEYAELKAELERIGYRLKVYKRATYAMHQQCRDEARR